MNKFFVYMSVLPPQATSKQSPLYNESGIYFECQNCTLSDAINMIFEHKDYIAFSKRNMFYSEPYVYYTDNNDIWCYFNGNEQNNITRPKAKGVVSLRKFII